MSERAQIPTLSVADTLAVLAEVITPNVAKGVIIRRPRVVSMAERMDLDRRAVRRLQRLRKRYGPGPLMLRTPIRNQAVVLDPVDVRRVLFGSPDPFSTATPEKRAALSHFEPRNALITPPGPEREARREFNERALESGNPMHRLADRFLAVVEDEAEELLSCIQRGGGVLDWDMFSDGWFRIVRRVVFGDGARDDHELRALIDDLRADANWAFLKPKNRSARERFFERLNGHLARAESGSLAAVIATLPKHGDAAPDHQVPQWLFAFDPAGIATYRALALLATHPRYALAARSEIRRGSPDPARHLPFLRGCVLESLRLWPTTPMVLRQTTEPTTWDNGTMPADTGVLVFAPFFHRDDEVLPYADTFRPELWLEEGMEQQGQPPREWTLIPFSDGPAVCPGRNLVLLLTSQMLGNLINAPDVRLVRGERLEAGNLPGTLSHHSLAFRFSE